MGQDLISKPKVKDAEESSFPLLQWKTKGLNKQDARATESPLRQEEQAGCGAEEREGLGAWGLARVAIVSPRNEKIDTGMQPTAYLEGSCSPLV